MRRARHDLDRVARTNVALAHDTEVRAHATLGLKSAREVRVVHADAELVAGKARLRAFEDDRADLPSLPDDRLPEIDALDGEVLAKQPGSGRDTVAVAPQSPIAPSEALCSCQPRRPASWRTFVSMRARLPG